MLPPLVDYPNHLARMHLLAEGGDAFYRVRWTPLPNLAEDLIVPPLGRLMPLDTAAKLFLVMIFALMAGGVVWLNRVATGAWGLWPLLGFLLLYNRILLWGFLNYLFGVGVALAGAALWLALEGRRWWLRVASSSLVASACLFSHIAAFGVYALVILGVEAVPALAELRARRWRLLGRRIAIAAPQLIAPSVLWLGLRHDVPAGSPNYAGLWRKPDLLFIVFDNYHRSFDLACFALFLLLIAAGAPRFPSRRVATAVGAVAASVLVVRLAAIEQVWRTADRVYSADLAGIDGLPPGSRLAIAHPADLFHVVAVPEVHVATLAIARREAFVPSLFAIRGQQPLALRPGFKALAEAAQPQRLWATLAGGAAASGERLPATLEPFDFVVLTDKHPIHLPANRCLAPFFLRPTFQIYAVSRDLDCAGPAG